MEEASKAANGSAQTSIWPARCIAEPLISAEVTSPQRCCRPSPTWQKLHGFGSRVWVWMLCVFNNISLYAMLPEKLRVQLLLGLSPLETFAQRLSPPEGISFHKYWPLTNVRGNYQLQLMHWHLLPFMIMNCCTESWKCLCLSCLSHAPSLFCSMRINAQIKAECYTKPQPCRTCSLDQSMYSNSG